MFVLAVTGGIGAGKSEAAAFFADRGAVVLDLDAMAKGLLSDPAVLGRIVEAFGEDVLDAEGRVDKRRLAERAFAEDRDTRLLDEILHPAVLREVVTGLERLSLMEHPPRVAVLDVPLLVESPALQEVADLVLAIAAPEDVRVTRAVARGMAEADVRTRLERQATDTERAAIADEVIENTGTLDEFRNALTRFWEREVAAGAA
jgi:dephospho-CoA kinase